MILEHNSYLSIQFKLATYICRLIKFGEKIIKSCNQVLNSINWNFSSIDDFLSELLCQRSESTNVCIQYGDILVSLDECFTESLRHSIIGEVAQEVADLLPHL